MRKILLLTITLLTLTLNACIEQVFMSSLLFDLDSADYDIKFGLQIDESNYGEQLQEMNEAYQELGIHFTNLHTFESKRDSEYGFIYEVADKTQREMFFEERKEFSYHSDEIIFIYEVDYYILEVYHKTDSVFPGFLSTYEYSSNYQYNLFYEEESTHPFISNMITQEVVDLTWYLEADLVEHHELFNTLNIPMEKVATFTLDQQKVTLIVCLNTSDRDLIYTNQESLYVQKEGMIGVVVKYQNLVFVIEIASEDKDTFMEIHFNDFNYLSYDIV